MTTRRGFFASLFAAAAAPALARLAPAKIGETIHVRTPPRFTVTEPPALSIRFIREYNVNEDRFITRCDTLYGYGNLDTHMAIDFAAVPYAAWVEEHQLNIGFPG
jgi:hypothetical protein